MTGKYLLSPRAQADLDEIWDWTAAHWSAAQADSYIQKLRLDVEAVAANPSLGRRCPHIRRGYHRYPAGSHQLFYRVTDDGIEIVRILHSRMDPRRHL